MPPDVPKWLEDIRDAGGFIGRVPNRIASFPGFILVSILFLAFNSVSFSQEQTLLLEDFETGDPLPEGWTVEGFPVALWHIAENGECLAETRMGAYNHGQGGCDYNTGDNNFGRLKSPPFVVTGDPPFTLSFDYIRSVDPFGDGACVWIVKADNSTSQGIECVTDNSGTAQFSEMQVPNPSFWGGQEVRIEFEFFADPNGNNNPGWFVDNVEVRNSSPEPPVPAVTDWGLLVMTLLLLAAGTVVFRRAGSAGPNWPRSGRVSARE